MEKRLVSGSSSLFDLPGSPKGFSPEREAELYQKIGQLQVELEWLKKNLNHFPEEKRGLVEPDHPRISIVRQCKLLGISRSGYYYQPQGESEENLLLMRLIDE